MKPFVAIAVRVGLVAICILVSWRAIRLATADAISAPYTVASMERAVALEPDNAELVARAALLRSGGGDPSAEVDRELEHALRLNPLNSEALISLGERREFEGNIEAARKYFERAAEVDHAFRASWAMASFASRNNLPDEFWKMAERCLRLEPLVYDPEPVFDLAWQMSSDARKIKALVPQTGGRSMQYLAYLMGTERTEAAEDAWPAALHALDASTERFLPTLLEFPAFLLSQGRVSPAVKVWNDLVGRNLIHSSPLKPAEGIAIADPTFSNPLDTKPFGWKETGYAGAFISEAQSMLRMEFDGNEPESLELLSVLAPVVRGKSYRLVWKHDSSRLRSPEDAGFGFVVSLPREGGAMEIISHCGPVLAGKDAGSCSFQVPTDPARRGEEPQMAAARIQLNYVRAPGTVRIRGELRLTEVHVEFGS